MNVDGRLYKEASWLVENTNLVKQISETCQNKVNKKKHVESSNVNPFWLASGTQTLGLLENPPAIVRFPAN